MVQVFWLVQVDVLEMSVVGGVGGVCDVWYVFGSGWGGRCWG